MIKAYLDALADFQNDIKTFCRKRDVGFFTVRTDIPIEKELFGDLLKEGIMV